MFIRVHGINLNEKIYLNIKDIAGIQEIKDGSKKYMQYKDLGAKTVIIVGGTALPVKESIITLENILKKAELIVGGK